MMSRFRRRNLSANRQGGGNVGAPFSMPESVLSALFKISGRPEARDSVIGSLELDVSKAASTGWRTQVSLDEGLHLAAGKHDRG